MPVHERCALRRLPEWGNRFDRVSYFASKHSALHTFSVLSQSTLTNGDAPTAHRAARTFQLPNHMVLFDWRKLDVSPSLWRTILWKVETPIAGAEQFYKYL